MRKYASSRVKRKSFYRKSELQMFLLISDGLIGVSTSPYWKVRETFPQITQKLWATKTWDLAKLFIYYSFITFHFLGFFHLTVSNLYYCAVFIAWQWKRSFVTSAYIEVKMSLYCPLPIAHLVLKCHNFFWPYHKSFIDQAWSGQDGKLAFFFFWLISSKVLTSHLRWCYARRFATTIFSATQRCNIVPTLFRIVTT